jgi:phage baseplate assembly protein W
VANGPQPLDDPSSKAFLGRGWSFPVRPDAAGAITMAAYEEDVRQAILIILRTNPGERVMRPDFGAGLDALVFEPIGATTTALVKHRVEQALILWEPRIDNIGVEVEATSKEGRLDIGIRYRVRATNTFYNLVYPFYLREATG